MILDLMTVVTVMTPRHREGRQPKSSLTSHSRTGELWAGRFAVADAVGDEVAIVAVPLTMPLPWVTVSASSSRMRYEWRIGSAFPAFVSR